MCVMDSSLCLRHQYFKFDEIQSHSALFTAASTVPDVRLSLNRLWLNKQMAEQITYI